jgi:hypothetical protein
MTMGWDNIVAFTPSLVGCVVASGNHSHRMIRDSGECVNPLNVLPQAPQRYRCKPLAKPCRPNVGDAQRGHFIRSRAIWSISAAIRSPLTSADMKQHTARRPLVLRARSLAHKRVKWSGTVFDAAMLLSNRIGRAGWTSAVQIGSTKAQS